MPNLTKEQLMTIHTLFSKLGMTKEQKDTIVTGFLGGRSKSSKDLTVKEATSLISHLKSLDPSEKKAEVMRRKILSLAHEMGWKKPGSTSIDMIRVDQWCIKYSYAHKKLNHYTLPELPKLVTQFEQGPYKHYLNACHANQGPESRR